MNLDELGLSEEQIAVVNKAIQSSEDKVRTDYSKQLTSLKSELLTLKPVDKTDAEKALELRQQEIDNKEKEFAKKEKEYLVKEKLASAKLPSDLARFLNVGEDIDTQINELGGTLNAYFLENGYQPTSHAKNEGLTKEGFKKLSYAERNALFATNPELHNKLAN